MKIMNKRYLCCCILSALSFSVSAEVYDFISSENPQFDEPIEHGWDNYLSGSAYGEAVKKGKGVEWFVNGEDGRANWKITPTDALNDQATAFGWTMSAEMRVKKGGYLTNYYANGEYRFLPIISLQDNQLTAEFEGEDQQVVLATGRDAKKYHQYDIVFHPGETPTASFYFDGELIKSGWEPTPTTQNMVVWGNGSSHVDAKAYYRSVNFTISGESVFSSPDRIPSLVVSSETPGTVVIFAEKRVGGSDPGSIYNTNDIITKTSRDYGRTWSEEVNLTEQINLNDEYDFSDPRPIYLPDEDEIVVSYVRWPTDAAQNGDKIKYWMDSGVFYSTYDVEDGEWSAPFNVTEDIKERTFQIIGWGGSEYYTKSVELSSQDEWELTTKLRIQGGGANDLSVSNGDKRFTLSLAMGNESSLVAYVDESTTPITIREKTENITGFVDVSLRFDPEEGSANLYIDDDFITEVAGIPSTDTQVLFGQTANDIEGRMHIANLALSRQGDAVIEFDAEALSLINPSEQNVLPDALGWTKNHSGRAYSFYGVASVNPGPGHGIQLEHQTDETGDDNDDRLIYPAITLDKYFLNVSSVFSDDDGVTWETGAYLPIPYRWQPGHLETLEPSEADMVELTNGQLLLTTRLDFNTEVDGVNFGPRQQFISNDGGMTWEMPENYGHAQFPNMSTGKVDASITRFVEDDDTSYLLFTNPIGTLPGNSGRNNLGLWFSFDEGVTWKGPIQLVNAGSAYSDIYQLDDENAMVIVEDNGPEIRTLTVPVTKLKQLITTH
ncbi:exo-alpha-sialidase [Enterovibrio coralii]|uniref:exo-alpha-sialidase n=1 Tax=Enterovibrio coralii TaxID=294935 RepID=A0A135I7Y9_9GAMM|nr:exo-alpha-sialidase [Enterovibrio coralii]KXF81571.1 sialidase [Enterovibrio coralii]